MNRIGWYRAVSTGRRASIAEGCAHAGVRGFRGRSRGGGFSACPRALSDAGAHWRGFPKSLIARSLRGVAFIRSDDHAGLRPARCAMLGGATRRRRQSHLAENAIHQAPNAAIRKRIGAELRAV